MNDFLNVPSRLMKVFPILIILFLEFFCYGLDTRWHKFPDTVPLKTITSLLTFPCYKNACKTQNTKCVYWLITFLDKMGSAYQNTFVIYQCHLNV